MALPSSQVSLKTAFTVCFAVVVTLGLVLFVYATRVALAVTLVSGLIAVALDHGVQALARRGIRRSWALAVVIASFVAVLVGLGLLVIPALMSQGRSLSEQIPTLVQKLRQSHLLELLRGQFGTPEQVPEQVADQGEQLVQGAARPVLAALGGVLSVAATMLSLLFLTLFSLIFGGSLTRALLTEARPERRELYQRMLDKTYDSVGGYMVGLLFICTVNGVLTTVFLAVTDTPFFLPLGILSGFSSMVPYAGPIVVGSGITVITFATGGTVKALMAATWFILYGQFEGQILAPLVFKRTVHINPLLTLASVLFFGELAGIAGAVLAVPLTTTLQIVGRELLAIRRARMQLIEPAAPEGTPPPAILPPGPVPPANPPTPLQ